MFERFLQNITGWDLLGFMFIIVSTIGFAGDMPRDNDMEIAFLIVGLVCFCLGRHEHSKERLDMLHDKVDELMKLTKRQKEEIEELNETLKKR